MEEVENRELTFTPHINANSAAVRVFSCFHSSLMLPSPPTTFPLLYTLLVSVCVFDA